MKEWEKENVLKEYGDDVFGNLNTCKYVVYNNERLYLDNELVEYIQAQIDKALEDLLEEIEQCYSMDMGDYIEISHKNFEQLKAKTLNK